MVAGLLVAGFAGDAMAQQAAVPPQPTQLSDVSAQNAVPPRSRPRVRVTPQPPAWTYPRPGSYSWPGPHAVRDCRSWLEPEARASGPIVVPRMQCWWVRY
jgi:hypothetical protein